MSGIIDLHTHIFPDKIAEKTISYLAKKGSIRPYSDGTEAGLVSAMEKADVSLAIALPAITKPSQFDTVNAYAQSVNERYAKSKRRILSFGGIHPACEDIDGKMAELARRGFKGVKIHPDYQGEYIDSPGYKRIFECAKELGLIVVMHAGYDNGFPGEPVKCPPALLRSVMKSVEHGNVVVGHYGGHLIWNEVYEQLTDLDVYLDTAYTLCEIDREIFLKILRAVGDERVLFATDSPWRDIAEEADILRSYGLGAETEQRIFHDNAVKLLGL